MHNMLKIPKNYEKYPYEPTRFYVQRILEYNIVTLNLLPGQLVSANELSQELNISRTPIHDAFIELSKKSLTTIIPQVGTKIALINIEKAKAVSFLRHSAEMKMLEKACSSITDQEISLLRRYIELQEFAAQEKDYLKFLDHDDAFHTLLMKKADLLEVKVLLDPYMPIFNRVRMMFYKYLAVPSTIEEHKALLGFIETKNLDGAIEELNKHLLSDVSRDLGILKERLPEYFETDGQRLY